MSEIRVRRFEQGDVVRRCVRKYEASKEVSVKR